MNKDKDVYDKYFFDRASEMEAPSAIAIVEILIRHFSPESVIDIGCGPGTYLKEFQKKELIFWAMTIHPLLLRSRW